MGSSVGSIADHPLVVATLAAMQRSLAKPVRKKEPITPDMLWQIVNSMSDPPSLSDLRTSAVCLLAFAGFFWIDEVLKLRCEDVQFCADHMKIRVRGSKTDQYRKGDTVLVARSSECTCPVAMLEKYIKLGRVDTKPSEFLFRGISKTKYRESLRSGPISYTRLREVVKQKLKDLGFDESVFGLHSLRAGGATAAANKGVPDRLFKRHGRWKSEAAKDGYILDSEVAMLEVTKQLGIW